MEAKTTKIIGNVVDQLGTMATLYTRSYATWGAAHMAAEKLCKRRYGKNTDTANRMYIDIVMAKDNT